MAASSHASFESLTEWYDLTATNEHVERILLGNLPSQGESEQRPRAVGIDQAKRFARDCKMEFFEVKLGNVRAFYDVILQGVMVYSQRIICKSKSTF